ncbi:MAG TPA: 50S ribosomal protein L33 [bacterium]|nr:50S ribosomal protein L33 [bacterium]
MAKGKTTRMALYSSESKIMGYVREINKSMIPAGQKFATRKYDKKLRKHVTFTAKDIKKG